MERIVRTPGPLALTGTAAPEAEEATMYEVIAPTSVQLSGEAESEPIRNRRVRARDLHPGDIVQQHDWPLHVLGVEIGPTVVTVAVTEFGFELHYAAEEMLRLAG
jgi:hypothetical protein